VQSLLHFIKYRLGIDSAHAWILPVESECLLRHAAGKKRLAEVGTWEGGTTRKLRAVMSPEGTIFAVDPYAPGRLGVSYQRMIAAREVARARNGKVVWLYTTGVDAARDSGVLAARFDFVFVDGDHTYEGLSADWTAWSPLIAPGGIVALHDSLAPEGHADGGSVRYSNEVIAQDPRFEQVDQATTLRVLRRVTSGAAG
jgi:predicted O-methyltransferase YrrM